MIDNIAIFNCTLLQVDALKDDGGWYWNNLFKLESGIMISEDSDLLNSSRKLLKYFRDNLGVLSEYSKGRVCIDWGHDIADGVMITVCNKNTGEPLFAISSIHN